MMTEHLVGIIAMFCGFIALSIENLGGAYYCFGYAFILWCLLTIQKLKEEKQDVSTKK